MSWRTLAPGIAGCVAAVVIATVVPLVTAETISGYSSAARIEAPDNNDSGQRAPVEDSGRFTDRIPAFESPPRVDTSWKPNSSGPAAAVHQVPTKDPVVFITIDDGWVRDDDAIELLREANVPVTMFLTSAPVSQDPEFFTDLRETGATVQAHTRSHIAMPSLSYDAQREEICGNRDDLKSIARQSPSLFRPPYGEYNADTLSAAADCGMDGVVHWTATVDKGEVAYQSGSSLRNGDIVLMHFREEFVADFVATLNAIDDAGLTPALLDDYLAPLANTHSPGGHIRVWNKRRKTDVRAKSAKNLEPLVPRI